MLKRRLLVISLAALCLSAAPAMADFVDLTAYETAMTLTDVWDGTTATATVEAQYPTSSMEMYIKDDGGNILQSLIVEPYDLTATLYFTVAGDDYSAIGSLLVYDDTSSINPKIAADFVSETVTFTPEKLPWGPWVSTLDVTGYLTPQGTNTSILLGGSSWEFATSATENISLVDADDFDHGNMVVFQYYVPYGSLQEFLAAGTMDAYGLLNAEIYSTPIPAAVLLGVIGLGVVGLKLRKYA